MDRPLSLPGGFFLRTKPSRSFLAFLTAIIILIPTCYHLQALRLERQNVQSILSLDLEVAVHFAKGKTTIDRWGRLKRADVQVTCSGGAPGRTTVDWSNSQTCLNNAVLHTNCVPLCDSSFSTCAGCDALKLDHDTQLATATQRCNDRAATVCTLGTKANDQYDYVALSTCCQSAIPYTAPSCLCENQQSAAPSCFAYGQCLSNCQANALRTTCPGATSVLPTPPIVCTNPLAASCSGPGTGHDLTCTSTNVLYQGNCQANQCLAQSSTPFLLNLPTYQECYSSCPPGPLTPGLQTYKGAYNGYSGANNLCSACPAGKYGYSNQCVACPQANAGTCSGPSSLLSCAAGFTALIPQNTCITGLCPPYIVNSSGQQSLILPILYATGPACVVGSSTGITVGAAYSAVYLGCGKVSSGIQYYANKVTNQCVSVSKCPTANSGTVDSDGYGVCN